MSEPIILTVAEHRHGDLREVSLELITSGRELADALDGELHVAVVSGDVEAHADALNREGVDAIHTIGIGEEFDHTVYQRAVEKLADEFEPTALLMPNSVNGLDYAPAVAESLDMPLVTDAIDLTYDDGLTVTREQYGSKAETTVGIEGDRFALTVRGGEWPAAQDTGDAVVEPFDVDIDPSESGVRVQGYEEVGSGDVDISDADVLVSIGRGIEEEDNLDLIFDLAEAMDATVSSSRPIVDNGWLPKNRQVGQSGKVARPDVYLAIGISGAVQHVAGMKDSETIVAINTDPNAPIFDIADYGIVGDLFDIVPELIDDFE